jgi:rSAM/selenodomain-associated transferase 1
VETGATARLAIAIFARPPIPGACKTRLGAAIGGERAAMLYRAFVEDAIALSRAVPRLAPRLHVTAMHPFLSEVSERFSLGEPIVQEGADLGARMVHALRSAPLVIGTDAPAMPRALLEDAIASLDAADAVVAPAADGGYALIGSRKELPPLDSVRWSSPHALADTLRALAPLRVALTAPSYDVDDLADLRLLRAHLALDPALAPASRAALSKIPDF